MCGSGIERREIERKEKGKQTSERGEGVRKGYGCRGLRWG